MFSSRHRLMGYNISNNIAKGNDMETAILTLHYCRIHHLLFLPSLHEWLSFTPMQIEHTFGQTLRLTESACPRCLPAPKRDTSFVRLEASGF